MKKKLLSFSFLLLALSPRAQVNTVTVSTGSGYTNNKWYSLENGEIATQLKDNWDIAFEISGYSSAILANTQKPNFALYKAPYSISNYNTIDTSGINAWPVLYNSDTSWAVGAFNRGANPSNPSDLGWGVYDMNTHFVNGDSCYVLKLSQTAYKKLKIISLANGAYNFVYADINGANSFTQSIAKSAYPGKNFAYFDLSTNIALDREPTSTNWDLVFGRYTAHIPTAYNVVGVMANKGVNVAQMDNIANPAAYSSWYGQPYKTNITTIGNDWKSFDPNTNAWKMVNDTIYFVKDKPGNIWKLRFISFGGSSNGDFVFSKEKLSLVGVADQSGKIVSRVALFPNPASGGNSNLLISSTKAGVAKIEMLDTNGKILTSERIDLEEGITTRQILTSKLEAGVYFVKVSHGSASMVQKLIVH